MAKSPSLFLLNSSCDFSGNQTDVGQLVISFIFLVAFALIYILWFNDIKSFGSIGKFPVLGFTVALVAAFINYALNITSLFIVHCTYEYAIGDGLSVGSFVAGGIQDLINVGIVLIYVVPRVIDLSKPFRVAHVIVLAIISAIFVPFIVVDGLYYLGPSVLDQTDAVPSPDVALSLAAAYAFLLLCVATYCVGILIISRFTRRTDSNPRKNLTDWIVIAILCLFVLRLLNVIYIFAWSLPNSVDIDTGFVYIPQRVVIAFYSLTSLASAASFLGIAKTRF